ncbi:hypothetical protein BAE44_0004710 [Dichanthelium oligosanthes]|uniref:Disease resistance N-terminal domain-containing protein n=1 Tax=Dichanthelium oligosanthes TaxID=888268 RepID=A0A1E5WA44_9POAL|nr:hypothetical protein BAE44_0004710 [Dichanthelium oligosanthes]
MGNLLDKLGKLVTGDYSLDPSIKKDNESFSVKLRKIHLDLPELQNLVRAKVFVDEIRELSYNIEDMVDSFLVRVEPDSSSSGFMEIMHESVKLFENGRTTHHQIGDVIRDIKEKVQAVFHKKEEYNLNVNNVVANATDKAAIYPRMDVYRNKNSSLALKRQEMR